MPKALLWIAGVVIAVIIIIAIVKTLVKMLLWILPVAAIAGILYFIYRQMKKSQG